MLGEVGEVAVEADTMLGTKLFRAHFVLLFVFSGTRPLANSESSSLANFKRLDAVWTLEVGLFEWFAVLEMGGTAGRGKLRSARGQSVHSGPLTHPETVWVVRASHFSLEKYFSSTLLC